MVASRFPGEIARAELRLGGDVGRRSPLRYRRCSARAVAGAARGVAARCQRRCAPEAGRSGPAADRASFHAKATVWLSAGDFCIDDEAAAWSVDVIGMTAVPRKGDIHVGSLISCGRTPRLIVGRRIAWSLQARSAYEASLLPARRD